MGALASPAAALPFAQSEAALDVRAFGAVGNGVANDTAAFASALRAATTLFVPAGVYLVDGIAIPAGRSVLTAGVSTVFRQRAGLKGDRRLLTIAGSNVRLGDCTVEGNIATDRGEQRHGIFAEATATTGDLSNIAIGNVRGARLRGDVVYIGARDGRSISDVHVGQVEASNISRNVVSVVGGSRITIQRIAGSQVGYMHLDIEPDEYNGPVAGCTVGEVHGGYVQIAGQSAEAYVDQVRIGLLDLLAPQSGSAPLYPHWQGLRDAVTIRNIRSLEIGRLVAAGFGGSAIRQVWDPGALSDQRVHIATAEINDCCKDKRAPQSYILGNRHSTRLRIDALEVSLARPGIDVVRDCKEASIGRVRGLPLKGNRLIASSMVDDEALAYAAFGASALAGGYYVARRLRR